MRRPENNYAFIDSQNLNLGIRSCGWRIDWRRFRVYLREKYGVRKAFVFIGFVEGNESLYTMLQDAGFVCIFKPTLRDGRGHVKGNVDAELVLHTMIEYENYKQAVIVSGDGDFACLVRYLVRNDKLCRLLVPNKRYSGLLKKASRGHITILGEMSTKLSYGQKRKEPRRD